MMKQSTNFHSMQACSLCQLEPLEHYKLSDFVHEDRYRMDTTLAVTYEQALHMLKHVAGPVFVDRRGRRVWFAGLDEVVQSSMIAALTRPINDKEEFIRSMPKGKWSDYEGREESQLDYGVTGAQHLKKYEAMMVYVSNGDYCDSPDHAVRIETMEKTPGTPSTPADDRDRRKDSAHSVEEAATKDRQPTASYRPRSSPVERSPAGPRKRKQQFRCNAHDKIAFVDDLRTIAKRIVPAVELNWHRSKYRVAPTLKEFLAEWGEENVVVQSHPLRAEGSITSTLSKASPLNH